MAVSMGSVSKLVNFGNIQNVINGVDFALVTIVEFKKLFCFFQYGMAGFY